MALLKALALGAIGAMAMPFVLRNEAGLIHELMSYWTVRPVPGEFGLIFSVPVFLVVTGFGWVLLKIAEDR
ncbi:hypothetical protein ABC347_06570 [Sphingomonas sp. 1P06PA]|uniref:hypothetical protein n=1 Tax=Sphingomonas sp. 1P06PA TaxID=554121 RepID=UPI0039A5715F